MAATASAMASHLQSSFASSFTRGLAGSGSPFRLSPSKRTSTVKAIQSDKPTYQVIQPINGDPFIGSLETPITSSPLIAIFSFTTNYLLTSLPSLASETLTSSSTAEKISFDSVLVSIDDFFNRYPFFVAGCTFIWLVVIPVTQQYLRKYKFISAIDAFRKLKEDKDAQLLDIRDKRSLVALGGSPNLKILNKIAFQVQFSDECEDGFVKNVLENFADPANTSLCILDDFDGNSLRAAELLYKNGFKEAFAIRGGVRGKKGWLAIQETLLPPSVHINPKKKKKSKISQVGTNGGVSQQSEEKNGNAPSEALSKPESLRLDNGHLNKLTISTPHTKIDCRSPYRNYPDLKPPSSPTPSKP